MIYSLNIADTNKLGSSIRSMMVSPTIIAHSAKFHRGNPRATTRKQYNCRKELKILYLHTVVTIQAEHNSMYVMRPGTQSTLQHRVVRGNIKQPENQVRYSISFRKSKPENTEPIADSFQQGTTCSSGSVLTSVL